MYEHSIKTFRSEYFGHVSGAQHALLLPFLCLLHPWAELHARVHVCLMQSWLTVCHVQLCLHYCLHARSALSSLLHYMEAGGLCCCMYCIAQTLQKGIHDDTSMFIHDKNTKKSPSFSITLQKAGTFAMQTSMVFCFYCCWSSSDELLTEGVWGVDGINTRAFICKGNMCGFTYTSFRSERHLSATTSHFSQTY